MKNLTIIFLLSVLLLSCSENKNEIPINEIPILEQKQLAEDPIAVDFFYAIYDSRKIFSSISIDKNTYNRIKEKNGGKICNAQKQDFGGDSNLELYVSTICNLSEKKKVFSDKYPQFQNLSEKKRREINTFMKADYNKVIKNSSYEGLAKNFPNEISEETKTELVKLITEGGNPDMDLLEANLGLDSETLVSIASKYLEVGK